MNYDNLPKRYNCCNFDCSNYPANHISCFNDKLKCVWFVIALKNKGYTYNKLIDKFEKDEKS